MKMIRSIDHLETLIGSIEKMFLNAQNKGIIKNKELSLLNLIFKLIKNKCFNDMNNKDEFALYSLYYKILNKYSFLCKSELIRNYNYKSNTNTTYLPDDCYVAPTENVIYYWQEENLLTEIDNIEDTIIVDGFFENKLNDTYLNFEIGKLISYNNIGRICFAAMNSDILNYEIRDALNNIVTSAFDIVLVPTYHLTLIVSKNVYSHGDINLKIKKL